MQNNYLFLAYNSMQNSCLHTVIEDFGINNYVNNPLNISISDLYLHPLKLEFSILSNINNKFFNLI